MARPRCGVIRALWWHIKGTRYQSAIMARTIEDRIRINWPEEWEFLYSSGHSCGHDDKMATAPYMSYCSV
jgi:hypothetical protein